MSEPDQAPVDQPPEPIKEPPAIAAAYNDLPVWFRMLMFAVIAGGFFYALKKGDSLNAFAAMAVLGTGLGADRALRRLGNGS